MVKKKSVREHTDSIRENCDAIDEAVEDKKVSTRGDPVVMIHE